MQNVDPELLQSFHLDIKDGYPLNRHLEIRKTTSSSKPYVLMGKNFIGWVR